MKKEISTYDLLGFDCHDQCANKILIDFVKNSIEFEIDQAVDVSPSGYLTRNLKFFNIQNLTITPIEHLGNDDIGIDYLNFKQIAENLYEVSIDLMRYDSSRAPIQVSFSYTELIIDKN
jgi:hypothetical protein